MSSPWTQKSQSCWSSVSNVVIYGAASTTSSTHLIARTWWQMNSEIETKLLLMNSMKWMTRKIKITAGSPFCIFLVHWIRAAPCALLFLHQYALRPRAVPLAVSPAVADSRVRNEPCRNIHRTKRVLPWARSFFFLNVFLLNAMKEVTPRSTD